MGCITFMDAGIVLILDNSFHRTRKATTCTAAMQSAFKMLCNADDPEDREAIEAGFDLWARGGLLTYASLNAILRTHPRIAKAVAPQRAYPDMQLNVVLSYPYPVGYFDDGAAGRFTRSR